MKSSTIQIVLLFGACHGLSDLDFDRNVYKIEDFSGLENDDSVWIQPEERPSGARQKKSSSAGIELWPNGKVSYAIAVDRNGDDGLTELQRENIKEAMNIISTSTCVEFVARKEHEASWLIICGIGPCAFGCSSALGRNKTHATVLKLGTATGNCVDLVPAILHELLHSLGLYHEHQRPDRDDYVKIHWDNLIGGRHGKDGRVSFEKASEALHPRLKDTKYDYSSIMHYGTKAGLKPPETETNRRPLINVGMGQNRLLVPKERLVIEPLPEPYLAAGQPPLGHEHEGATWSPLDIEKISLLYKCITRLYMTPDHYKFERDYGENEEDEDTEEKQLNLPPNYFMMFTGLCMPPNSSLYVVFHNTMMYSKQEPLVIPPQPPAEDTLCETMEVLTNLNYATFEPKRFTCEKDGYVTIELSLRSPDKVMKLVKGDFHLPCIYYDPGEAYDVLAYGTEECDDKAICGNVTLETFYVMQSISEYAPYMYP